MHVVRIVVGLLAAGFTLMICGCGPSALPAASGPSPVSSASSLPTKGAKTQSAAEYVKSLFPTSDSLMEVEFDGRKFAFCEVVAPTYGVSIITVHGWVYRPYKKDWEHLLTANLHGLGGIEMIVDREKGVFSVRGTANTKLKKVEVLKFDLQATVH